MKKLINLVYYKNTLGNWVVDSVYALPHSARARASKIRNAEGKDAFVLKRTLRKK